MSVNKHIKMSCGAVFLLYSLLTLNVSGQTIREMEQDLSWLYDYEKYGDKIETARKLQIADPFNRLATDYICRYYQNRGIDSITIYFDSLIARFPHNSEPLILRAELLHYEICYNCDRAQYNKQKTAYLEQALQINTNDSSVILKLAEAYYKDFIYPLEKQDTSFITKLDDNWPESALMDTTVKKSAFKYAADSALKYFYQLWNINAYRDIVYYPARQLECFLNKAGSGPIPQGAESGFNQCYFPSSFFSDLGEIGECDFTTDYLNKIELGNFQAQRVNHVLKNFQEDCLFNKGMPPETVIYRFTWIRCFRAPIVVRMENNNGTVYLYWKTWKMRKIGNDSKSLKLKSGKKKLRYDQWEKFEQLLSEARFDSLPNNKSIIITESEPFLLERKNQNSFKAHNTNCPDKKFTSACMFLLQMTHIRI